MEIVERNKERKVTDYDFMFIGGSKFAITLDEQAGDRIEELADRYVINTVARPGLTEEDGVDAETIDVFKAHLAFLAKCKRLQRMPTEEESFDMRNTLHALAKNVQ